MATDVTTQIVREAEPIEQAKLNLMQAAAALQPPPLPAYQVAGFTPEQIQAIQYGVQGIGAYQPYLAAGAQGVGAGMRGTVEAADILRGADTRAQYAAAQEALNQAYTPITEMGGLTGAKAYEQFMSPYQQAVTDVALREAQRQHDIARESRNASLAGAGAFGGSRQAIMEAEAERNLGQLKADLQAKGLQDAFAAAQQQQGLQASILGQRSQLGQALGAGIGSLAGQQFGVGQQMAQGIGALGTQLGNLGVQMGAMGQTGQQMGITDVNFLYNLGAEQQKLSQAALDAQRATAMQTAYQPYQQLAFISDIYRGAPSSQMAMTSQSAPTPSPFQQIAGLATGALATGAAAKKAGLF